MIPKEYESISEFKTAFEIAKQYNWSKEEMKIYDYVFMQDWKAQSIIDTAKEDGWNEGNEAGKMEIAKNLLDTLDDETISVKTGLSIDDVKKLRD